MGTWTGSNGSKWERESCCGYAFSKSSDGRCVQRGLDSVVVEETGEDDMKFTVSPSLVGLLFLKSERRPIAHASSF